ncbi:MAG: hypothetical protein K9N09_09980 [Candidatus Cloacimonetes bacterium]|nr:hypothetical protein [Candidatus Cloacimonadota bacterium]MCF7814418.1 hypothetical protein [Candidatus Cloacimonadota bacterium]MCF7869020.1 hypothetical protein [Candidatus Cloacimonadota bacterium]MCF7884402.1 hypothetical protein [Candidatus Cloacimonadota bacterium]
MSFEAISNFIAAFFTLSIFSFLYKDNPFYKFAEAMFVGVSMGYAIPLVYINTFIPFVYRPIFVEHNFWILIPALMGSLYIFRFSKNYSWLSRYPIVFGMAIVGMGVPLSMHASVLVQMRSAMMPIETLNSALIFVGTITILLYFFFSKEHKGVYGKITNIGIWYMMVGFGASFGYTVMARISLLIGRIQFLLGDWLGVMK